MLFYILLIAPIAIWLYMKMKYVREQKKFWREMIGNKKIYGRVLAEAVSKSQILETEFIDQEIAEDLIRALSELPPVEEIKKTIIFLSQYRAVIKENPELLDQKENIKEKIVKPVMRQFLYFLAVMDEEIRSNIEKEVKDAEEKGENVEERIKLLLQMAVNTALSW